MLIDEPRGLNLDASDLAEQGHRFGFFLSSLTWIDHGELAQGTCTCSKITRTISSTVFPSASASYDKITRCRSTSGATALTSSGET